MTAWRLKQDFLNVPVIGNLRLLTASLSILSNSIRVLLSVNFLFFKY